MAAVVLMTLAAAALADYIDLPVKWSQIPWDYYGDDWLSDCTVGVVMADDWLCNDPHPIIAIRWWGSYIGETEPRPDGWTGPFDVSVHCSTGEHPYSQPSEHFFFADNVTAQEVLVGYDYKGEPVYRYDAYVGPIGQVPGKEYFLDICKPTGENWGWHEVEPPHPILDFAVMGKSHNGPWYSTDTDLAFELMIVPEPGTLMTLALALSSLGLGLRVWRKK